jgi:hypothetical protein
MIGSCELSSLSRDSSMLFEDGSELLLLVIVVVVVVVVVLDSKVL